MGKEALISPEAEKQVESRVILEFMRHGEKEAAAEKTNQDLLLTEEGRKQATKKGKILNPQSEVAIGLGSPRKRTKETSARAISAFTPNALISSTVFCAVSFAGSISFIIILTPSLANANAIAFPIPCEPPVIRAFFPFIISPLERTPEPYLKFSASHS